MTPLPVRTRSREPTAVSEKTIGVLVTGLLVVVLIVVLVAMIGSTLNPPQVE